MTFADQVIRLTKRLSPDWDIPHQFDLIYPYDDPECWRVFNAFYHKYYSDDKPRIALLGINPGRFGAGITGIPFTDPVTLESNLDIPNTFKKKSELSSQFINMMIESFGDPHSFFDQFYIGSVCPLGFLTNGKNCNYYDDPILESSVMPYIIDALQSQIDLGLNIEIAYSIGQGKNFKFLTSLNERHHFFKKIEPLPHPRWVMQYQKKNIQKHLDTYHIKLSGHSLDE